MNFKTKEHQSIFLMFILTTFFLIFQHKTAQSWDFSVYVLNAKYLFSNGTYFELYRAPLASGLLGLLFIFGKLSEYIYLIITSTLFLIANLKLSNSIFKKYPKKELAQLIFYFFSLSIFVLVYATSVGTELLGLAFFELFLAALINKKVSGHYLGLAILTRYNFLIFFPFLFFNKNYKKIIKNTFLTFIIILPWGIFNFIRYNNWFASIIDSYALNVYLRDYIFQSFNFLIIAKLTTWFLPLTIIGLTLSILQIIKTKNLKSKSLSIIFILISILIIFDCYQIPLKIERYLFNLSLPIAFFSSIGFLYLYNKIKIPKKIIIFALVIIFLLIISTLTFGAYQRRHYTDKFYNAAQDIKKLDLTSCEILSPHWVPVTYYTENVYALGSNSIQSSIYNNKIILIFKGETTIDDLFKTSEIESTNKIYETEEYFLIGKVNLTKINCAPKYVYNSTIVNNHCEILSKRFTKIKLETISYKTCELINFNF
jgi:hypothetical protein